VGHLLKYRIYSALIAVLVFLSRIVLFLEIYSFIAVFSFFPAITKIRFSRKPKNMARNISEPSANVALICVANSSTVTGVYLVNVKRA